MTELDITWASDHMNMVLPNILLIYNYDNIVKQGLLATLKEKILDGFSIIKREVKNDSLGGQQDVKFDVVVGNPPYLSLCSGVLILSNSLNSCRPHKTSIFFVRPYRLSCS